MKRIVSVLALILVISFCAPGLFTGCVPEDVINELPPPEPDPEPGEDPGEDVKGNVAGTVTDIDGNPLEGVVVSDGLQSVKTDAKGRFGMDSDREKLKFVFVSTPSGYEPEVEKGLPKFYIPVAGKSGDALRTLNFTLKPVDQTRYTLFMTADPQPRASGAGYDKIGYHSLDCCADMYRDLKESAVVLDGAVYGICLGDIVHENMGLYQNYVTGLSTLGYPTWNVIGNHDNDTTAEDDDGGAAKFESWFGPRNYSFNLGSIHYVVLDNLIMYKAEGSTKMSSYYQGLTDDIWKWLQSDLAMVPKSATVAVCTHSPMFRLISGSERSTNSGTRHGKDYAALLKTFAKVHAWAGHTHTTFNYIYPSDGLYPNIEVHTLSRTTGELWTNEYLASGTPRGYTVVEVDGDNIQWHFRPIRYQTARLVPSTGPDYLLRDWSYDSSGKAVFPDGTYLNDSYQIHAYPPGTYPGDQRVYANVFLWDEAWGDVTFTPAAGAQVKMERVTDSGRYDAAMGEISGFYKLNSPTLAADSGYSALSTGNTNTLFRCNPGSAKSGRISVTDRFGKTWTRDISW